MGLGCVVALTVGLRLGLGWVERSMAPPEIAPEEIVTTPSLVMIYFIGVGVTAVMQEVAFRYPTLTQAILAFSFARLALIYLLLRRFIRAQPMRWDLVLALLAFEVGLGFTGYFSGFKEPMLLAALALLEAFDSRRTSHWVTGAALGVALIFASIMWMGVRGEFRQDFEDDVFASSRSARLNRMQALATDWFN
jgi:hypothetical protein